SRSSTLPSHVGPREVLNLAWPIIISMLSYTAMSVVDTIYVAQLGTLPLAGVGLAVTLVWATLAFGYGLLGGVRVEISQRWGAGDTNTSRRLVWQSVWLAILAGIGLVALIPSGPLLLGVMGAEGEVLEH